MGAVCSPSPLFCIFSQKLWSDYYLFPEMTLPALGGDPNTVTLSGTCGGSNTATQTHTAYSSSFQGVGLWIGGPYGTNNWDDQNYAQKGIDLANGFFAQGVIDDPSNFSGDPVWIFSGANDPLAQPVNQVAQKEYYENFGASVNLVVYDTEHKVPTIFAEGDDYLNTGYDTMGVMLEYLLTNLQTDPISSLNSADLNYKDNGVLRRFSQKEFVEASVFETVGLTEYGFVYYPFSCVDGTIQNCKVHLVHPGAFKNYVLKGEKLFSNYGYVQYASSNNLILIFPQQKFDWYNPFTRMDDSGYSTWFSDKYLTQEGPQNKAMKAMVDRVTGARDDSQWDYMATDVNLYKVSLGEQLFWQPYIFYKQFPEWLGANIIDLFFTVLLWVFSLFG